MSSTPRNAMGSRQTVSSELTPREFHPNCRSDRAALIACDGFSRSDCDWTGVSLSSLWVMAKSGAARYFESVKIGSPPFNRSLPLGRSWRTATHAYAHHNHKEKVFGEWVFDCQGAIPFSPHKGKQGKRFFVLSPCSPWEYSIFPSTQKTFLIFL